MVRKNSTAFNGGDDEAKVVVVGEVDDGGWCQGWQVMVGLVGGVGKRKGKMVYKNELGF